MATVSIKGKPSQDVECAKPRVVMCTNTELAKDIMWEQITADKETEE